MDLTEEEKEKLDGSFKVAKKLEKLQQRNAGAAVVAGDETPLNGEVEARSLDSESSEKTSSEASLTGSNGNFIPFDSFNWKFC